MIGPMVVHELRLGSRRSWLQIVRRVFCGWLVLQVLFFYFIYYVQANVYGAAHMGGTLNYGAVEQFGNGFTQNLVIQQLVLVFLATPAFVAGAIADEKQRGTLQYLMAADLTPSEIILGKLLGRTTQVLLLSICALPILCFVGVFGGLNIFALLALLAITIPPIFALGAASILASVWSRQTRDAVLAVYIGAFLAALALEWLGIEQILNPVHILEPAWGADPDILEVVRRFCISTFCWTVFGLVCYGLSVWRLRPAYLRQLAEEGRPKKARWWIAQRKPVPAEPIRWKERHVDGIAPFAFLRRVPRWLGMAVIFLVTSLVCISLHWQELIVNASDAEAWNYLRELDFIGLITKLGSPTSGFIWLGFTAMLLASLLVALRCSSAITSERERQTWEALLMSPMPAAELVGGKLSGVIGAAYPYLFAYAAPALLFASLGGIACVFWTILWLVVTWMAMHFLGAAGLWCSARAKNSWRSLLWTVVMGYATGFFLFSVAVPAMGLIMLAILVSLLLVDTAYGTSLTKLFVSTSWVFWVGALLFLIAGFVVLRSYFVRSAVAFIADRERVRHWQTEPASAPAQRRRVRARTTVDAGSPIATEKPEPTKSV